MCSTFVWHPIVADPKLLAFRVNVGATIQMAMNLEHLVDLFQLPLYPQAFQQFIMLQYGLQHLAEGTPGNETLI